MGSESDTTGASVEDSETWGSDSPSTPVHGPLGYVGQISARRPLAVVFITVLLIATAGGIAATNVTANIGMQAYIEDSSQAQQQFNHLNEEYDRGKAAYVMVEGDSVTDPETIRAIEQLDAKYSSNEEFRNVRSLADVVKAGNGGTIPETEAGVNRSIERVREQSNETAVLVDNIYPRQGMTVIIVSYGEVDVPRGEADLYGFMPKKEGEVVTETLRSDTDEVSLPEDTEATVTGIQVYRNRAFTTVFMEIIKLLSVGFSLVLFVLLVTMRSKLDRTWTAVLPLLSTVGAMTIMLGAMGIIGYRFNSMMLAVLPISLGLGVDYGLQIQSRYVEERADGFSRSQAARRATATTGYILLLAMITTGIGLGSLLVSPVPPTRQFGAVATISVFSAMFLAVTLLVALLSYFDVRPSDDGTDPGAGDPAQASASTGFPEKLTTAFATAVKSRPVPVLLVVVLLVGAGAYSYPQVETKEDLQEYWPQDLAAREDIERLQNTVDTPDRMYVIVETDDPYSPVTFQSLADAQDRIRDIEQVKAVSSPVSGAKRANRGTIPDDEARLEQAYDRATESDLIRLEEREDHPNSLVLTVYLEDVEGAETMAVRDRIEEIVAGSTSDARVDVTGQPVMNRVIINNVTSGRTRMTALSFGLGFLFLLVVFRSLKPPSLIIGGVPLASALVVAGGMYLYDIPWNPGTVMMSSIVLGIGIDYGLHVYERFQEHLDANVGFEDALLATMQKLSRPIIGSALTTMVGFGAQITSDFPIVANFGKTLVISMLAIMFATFVILPVMLTVVHSGDETANAAAG